jgi:hypothetical protein
VRHPFAQQKTEEMRSRQMQPKRIIIRERDPSPERVFVKRNCTLPRTPQRNVKQREIDEEQIARVIDGVLSRFGLLPSKYSDCNEKVQPPVHQKARPHSPEVPDMRMKTNGCEKAQIPIQRNPTIEKRLMKPQKANCCERQVPIQTKQPATSTEPSKASLEEKEPLAGEDLFDRVSHMLQQSGFPIIVRPEEYDRSNCPVAAESEKKVHQIEIHEAKKSTDPHENVPVNESEESNISMVEKLRRLSDPLIKPIERELPKKNTEDAEEVETLANEPREENFKESDAWPSVKISSDACSESDSVKSNLSMLEQLQRNSEPLVENILEATPNPVGGEWTNV